MTIEALDSQSVAALYTVKRVLDEVPDHVAAELWVNPTETLGAFVDAALAARPVTDDVQRLKVENERLTEWIAEATKLITGVAGGGSELFTRHGESFRADVVVCCQKIRDRHEKVHGHLLAQSKRATTAEAEVQRLNARIAELEGALEPFRSGGNWGKVKAWIVNGASTEAEGIAAAKAITKAQAELDRAALKEAKA